MLPHYLEKLALACVIADVTAVFLNIIFFDETGCEKRKSYRRHWHSQQTQ